MRGRVVQIADGYATYSGHGGACRCGQCPVRDGNGVCLVRAGFVSPLRPCCRYGHQRMRLAQVLRNNARRRQGKETGK